MTYSLFSFEVNGVQDNCVNKVELREIFCGFDCICEMKAKLEMLGTNLVEDTYLIIGFDEDTYDPLEVTGVYFLDENGGYIDTAEYDFRVIASIGLGVNLV